jgi:hypothetical protein
MFKLFSEAKLILQKPQSWILVFSAFLIPFALFYLLFSYSGKMIEEQIDGISKRKYKIAWIGSDNQATDLKKKMKIHLQLNLIENMDELQAMEAVKKDSIALAIVFDENFDSSIAQKKTADIILIFKGENRGLSIVEKLIKNYKNEIIKKNLAEINIPEGLVIPIEVTERDLTNNQEMIDNVYKIINNSLALILSILFLIFGFWGSRYASKTFINHEIENQNYYLKNLSSTAMSAKMMFFALFGFLAALNIKQTGIMDGIMIQLRSLFSWNAVLLLILSALTFAIFIHGLLNLINTRLKKSTSNMVSNILLVVFLMMFLLAGSSKTDLNYALALNPFSNIVLANKQLLEDSSPLNHVLAVWLILTLYGLMFHALALKKSNQ